MNQQRRRQTATQELQIAQVAQTIGFIAPRALDGTGQGGEDNGRVARVLQDEFIEDEMLRTAGQVVEAEWHGLAGGIAAGRGGRGGGVVSRLMPGGGGALDEHD